MKKDIFINKLKDKYDLPYNAKISLFRNQNELKCIEIEKINPTHRMIIWSTLQKRYRKTKYANKIQVGKIIIPSIFLLSFLNMDYTTLYYVLLNMVIGFSLGYLLFAFPIVGFIKPFLRFKDYLTC